MQNDKPSNEKDVVTSVTHRKRPRGVSCSNTSLRIQSLNDLDVQLAPDIIQHLASQHGNDEGYVDRWMAAMKRPVATTVCRVNLIRATRSEVLVELRRNLASMPNLDIQESKMFPDVIEIKEVQSACQSLNLATCTKPKSHPVGRSQDLFTKWPTRQEKGWPMTHKAILCDRFCGEAVLRGSDIFVRGVLAADPAIQAGEKVAVYADVPTAANGIPPKKLARGLLLENYMGNCVFLGLGTMACSRREVFSQPTGVAVSMSLDPSERVGPLLPPLSGVLVDKMMLQNLPSILVAHALKPQPGDFILDMCSAPGGKAAHLASLVKNQATIVACDRSRKKIVAARELLKTLGASCVIPLALDSTQCVSNEPGAFTSVTELLDKASTNPDDALKNVKTFCPETFDKILLDPPCSALGLRPKLVVAQQTLRQIDKHASYQRKFVDQAIQLLKPGGFMTYSTCTMNCSENEMVVNYVLAEHKSMELRPLDLSESMKKDFGRPGLEGFGLTEEQRMMVRRFEPGDADQDTMGFFVALFHKRATVT